MEPKNELTQNNQATNDQPKITWVEPELVNLGVEGGQDLRRSETTSAHPTSN